MDNYRLANGNEAAIRLIKSDNKLLPMKKMIFAAMVDYFGAEYENDIYKVFRNTDVHECNNYVEAEDVREFEGYKDYFMIKKSYYSWLKENAQHQIKIKGFILLNNSKIKSTNEKIYLLTKSYVEAFMSNNLEFNQAFYTRYKGNVRATYNTNDEMDLYSPSHGIDTFENACITCDAIMITKNILRKNNYKSFTKEDLDADRIMPLFENEKARKILDDARINHIPYNKLDDDVFYKVEGIINYVIPNLIKAEKTYDDKVNKIEEVDKTLNKLLTEHLKNNYVEKIKIKN